MTIPVMPEIDPLAVEAMIFELGTIGAHSGTGVCRTAYSPEWIQAQDLIMRWANDAGLDVRYDGVGNLWAKAQGTAPGDSIVSGSHIDSQRAGGRYDGALGIIAAFVAIRALYDAFGPPRRSLEMVSLCEEEGSRFPTAGFWGSRAIVGRASVEDCKTVIDENGVSIGQAMAELGYDPAKIAETKRTDIAAFLELHIEQGPVLEDADLSVAIVDAITHIRQTEITLTGISNHAGAFPMDIRADPMAGFSEIASAVIQYAEKSMDAILIQRRQQTFMPTTIR